MSAVTGFHGRAERTPRRSLKALVGAGDRIALVTLPFVIVGLALNVVYPSVFEVGGPRPWLQALSVVVLAVGVLAWAWSAVLILVRVPKDELITSGPYAVVKHPLYTSVALLVLPWLGFLLGSWLGAAIGVVLYTASRRYAPREEARLAAEFGPAWEAYCRGVKIPRL